MPYTAFPDLPPDPFMPDPRNSVTMRQARLALLGAPSPSGKGTLLDATNAAIAASGNTVLTIWWDYAATVKIDDPSVYAVGTSLGLSQDQVANLFSTASTL